MIRAKAFLTAAASIIALSLSIAHAEPGTAENATLPDDTYGEGCRNTLGRKQGPNRRSYLSRGAGAIAKPGRCGDLPRFAPWMASKRRASFRLVPGMAMGGWGS